MKRVVIIGAGGHGKVVADLIRRAGDRVEGFLDDNLGTSGLFAGIPVLGSVDGYPEYEKFSFVVAIGDATIRERIAERLGDVSWYTAVHPAATISGLDVEIGEGTVVMAGAVVNAGATVGRHCIINSGAIVEHDNMLEDYVHVSVGARLGGTVHIGKSTWIGIGASVSNNRSICSGCMIGAGAVVVKDIGQAGTYVGVPARRTM